MDFDTDLVILIAKWALTIVAWVLLAIVAGSLLGKEDPGGVLLDYGQKFTFTSVLLVAFYFSIFWVFAYGFSSLVWMLSEYSDIDDSYPKAATAAVGGVFATMVLFRLTERLNKLYWSSIGTAEILNDVREHFRHLSGQRDEVHAKLDALIEQIEIGKKSYENHSERIARERRIKFLKELKYDMYG